MLEYLTEKDRYLFGEKVSATFSRKPLHNHGGRNVRYSCGHLDTFVQGTIEIPSSRSSRLSLNEQGELLCDEYPFLDEKDGVVITPSPVAAAVSAFDLCFIITTDGKLYYGGPNDGYMAGVGVDLTRTSFKHIPLEDLAISISISYTMCVVRLTNDDDYVAVKDAVFKLV